jgi:dTDP-4-amino-4,6-dideoxygalactose transaminase
VDLHSWLLTSQIADDALKQCKFEAVIPVATFGVPQNVLDWSQWSNHNKIPVIIDAAGGFGTQMPHKDITVVYSLHATKSLPAGEGGLIVSSDPKLARQLKNMTNFGIGNLANADYCPNSTNAKLSEFHSAVALAALNNFDGQQIIRKETLNAYKQNLKEILHKGISLQMPHTESPTIFNIVCNTENQRNSIESSLNKNQIETRKWYQPFINKHPNLLSNIQSLQMTNSKMIENKIIGLPFYIDLKEEEIKYICIEIKKILR